jgi:hypothetical protein
MLYQLVSLVGAAMILVAYVALQRGRLSKDDRAFNLLNFVGSGLLTWIAVVDQRLGFIGLEGTWALLSLWPLLRPRRA